MTLSPSTSPSYSHITYLSKYKNFVNFESTIESHFANRYAFLETIVQFLMHNLTQICFHYHSDGCNKV